jgi:MFS family permease
VAAGNALEFYDFLTYGFFAPQIGRAFFPSKDHATELLVALASFGVGFLMRPVGAGVIGMIADKAGRKPAMLLSFTLMGVTMLGLALIPPAAQIGAWAGALAVVCRMIQGFALGGEVGPSTAYMIEAAPPDRRGFFVSLQFVSQQIAVTASSLVGFVLSLTLSPQALDSWGWRAAFLVGLAIVPFGLVMRRDLEETFTAPPPQARPAAPPPGFAPLVVLGMLMMAGGTTVTYLGNYMTTYATQTLHLSSVVGFAATLVVGLTGMASSAIAGWAGDRYGRRHFLFWPWALLLLALIPMFMVVASTRAVWALWGASFVMALCNQLFATNVLVTLTERMPAGMRGRALGLVYAVSISIFGGSAQYIAAALTKVTGSPLAPAWYGTAFIAVSLAAAIALPQKSQKTLSDASV